MWELIKREGLSRVLGPRGSLKKAGKPSETVPDLGEEVEPGVGGNKACSSVPDANKRCLVLSLFVWYACSLGIRWRQSCNLSMPELLQTIAK